MHKKIKINLKMKQECQVNFFENKTIGVKTYMVITKSEYSKNDEKIDAQHANNTTSGECLLLSGLPGFENGQEMLTNPDINNKIIIQSSIAEQIVDNKGDNINLQNILIALNKNCDKKNSCSTLNVLSFGSTKILPSKPNYLFNIFGFKGIELSSEMS